MPIGRNQVLQLIDAAGLDHETQARWTRVIPGINALHDMNFWMSFTNGGNVAEFHLRGATAAPAPFVPVPHAEALANHWGRVRFKLLATEHDNAAISHAVALVLHAMVHGQPVGPEWNVLHPEL